jgi:transcriptional regulator with XRE-family HTH domain
MAGYAAFVDYQRLHMRATEVGERIGRIREKLGLTQGEFAERLGVTRASVARYEAGRVPNLSLLRRIARLGRVSVGWILQEVPSQGPRRTRDESTSPPDTPVPVRNLLVFLRAEMVKLAPLPKERRKRYEDRLLELFARVKQDLEEYRHLLEGGRRQSRRRTRQSTKQRQTP